MSETQDPNVPPTTPNAPVFDPNVDPNAPQAPDTSPPEERDVDREREGELYDGGDIPRDPGQAPLETGDR